MLDLGEDVRRKKGRRARIAGLTKQLVELLLVQRVEAAGRLVEDEQLRPVHEGEHDAELLLVAARVFAKAAAEVQVEAFGDVAHDLGVGAAAHASEVGDHLLAAQAAELRHVAGHVADLVLDGDGVALAVEAEDVGGAEGRPDRAHEAANRRALPGSVRSEVTEHLLGRDLEVEVEEAVSEPVVLGQFRGPDCRGGHSSSILVAVQLGDLELHLLVAGHWKADGGLMFGVVPKVLWEKQKPADGNNMIDCACVGLIARVNGRVIVCETGIGTKLSEKRARQVALREPEGLLHSLRRVGIRPEEVDAVITTHLHWDHAGGLTRRDSQGGLELTFKRARHFIQRTEWDFALHPDVRSASGYVSDDFTPLADGNKAVEFLSGDAEVMPGVHVRHVGGHTPGSQVLVLRTGELACAVTGDLVCRLLLEKKNKKIASTFRLILALVTDVHV